jgi:Ca2+-binding RTX toxin-like protein
MLLKARNRRRGRITLCTAIGAGLAASIGAALVHAAGSAPHPARVKVTVDPLHGERTLEFVAGSGASDRVELRGAGAGLEIRDTVARVRLSADDGAGCTEVDDHAIRCTTSITFVYVHLADGDDSFADHTANINLVTVLGGDGDDDLVGGPSANVFYGENGRDELYGAGATTDTLLGGAGDDTIVGGSGADYLTGGIGTDHVDGGPGDDHLVEDPGADDLSGGAGTDTVEYENHDNGVTVTLDNVANDGFRAQPPLPAENDNVRDTIENVVGSPGSDSLIGSGRPNHLDGRGGDDLLDGGGGKDRLDGGDGSDSCIGPAVRDTCER